jgi:hypothetical protein
MGFRRTEQTAANWPLQNPGIFSDARLRIPWTGIVGSEIRPQAAVCAERKQTDSRPEQHDVE